MPFLYGKRSVGICVVVGRTSPGRLTISAARTNMVRLIRRTVRPQRIAANTPPVFFEPAASHLPASLFPRNEGLLGTDPSPRSKQLS